MSRFNPVMTGKGGKGYKMLAAGQDRKYLVVTIPLGMGFELGDRVCLQRKTIQGRPGVFIRKLAQEGEGGAG